jgi:murein DD-endopeptidase MepM/ murein hydrolase activator NlpD
MVGYTDNKSKLQTEINDYIEKGESENTAFVQVESLPEYKVCLLKRDVQASDEDIFNTIKSAGTTYYRYYSINENNEEKLYVANFTEAEDIINQLKEKNSKNMDNITISEKYETQMQDFTTVEDAVSNLYVQKPQVTVAKTKTTSVGSVNTATTIAGGKVSLGISLARPVSGIISSRFGARSSIRSSAHTGLDIATSTGTPVLAAASGTVTFSGRKGSYGNLLVITHSNGVQTYYGHCSKLYVSAGTTVTQGQTVAAVGSTGNSTGPHLHFEIRVNGVAYNPQNYLY